MNIDYTEILRKLKGMNTNSERLTTFDETFHIIVQEYAADNLLFALVNEDGSIQIENIKRMTDKLGMGTLSFYSPTEDKCVLIPTKDTILLMALAIGLQPRDADRLLISAGYGTYMKNLREFIMYNGLENRMTIDEVREKLIQYGYRENAALETVEYKPKKSSVKAFSSYFKQLCQMKGLSEKKVLEKAELVSSDLDAEQNRYYYSAFNGTKAGQVVLEYLQAVRLFEALKLSDDERLNYTKFLRNYDVINEKDKKLLYEWIQEGIKKEQEVWHSEKKAHVMEKSVLTQQIASGMKNIKWDKMDEFIDDHFGYIRSFALFYQQVLKFEGYDSVTKFCKAFKLSDRSHYSYLDGSSVPELSHLTAIACLMKKMTIQIYNTLLKKAGKLAYEEAEESAIYIIAKSFLLSKTEQVVMFGPLYNFVESLVMGQEENLVRVRREELSRLYFEVSKIVSRNLLAYVKESNAPANDEEITYIKSLTMESGKEMKINFSKLVAKVASRWEEQTIHEFKGILKNRLGFKEDSYLLRVMCVAPEIGVEIENG